MQDGPQLQLQARFSPELTLVGVKVELAVYTAAANGPVPQELLNPEGRTLTAKYRASLAKQQQELLADRISIDARSAARKTVTSRPFRLMLVSFAEQQVWF